MMMLMNAGVDVDDDGDVNDHDMMTRTMMVMKVMMVMMMMMMTTTTTTMMMMMMNGRITFCVATEALFTCCPAPKDQKPVKIQETSYW